MAFISNIGLLTEDALAGEPNEKQPTFNEEPFPDNDEVTALDWIPPPNSAGASNYIDGYIFYDTKEVVLVGKKYLESMLD